MKMWGAFFSLIAVALASTFLLWEGVVTVVVENVGAEPMRGVVVHVTGAAYPVGELAPGAKTTIVVNPQGESHVEIEQSSGLRLVVDCYFEPGYTGMVTAKVSSTKVHSIKDVVNPSRIGAIFQSIGLLQRIAHPHPVISNVEAVKKPTPKANRVIVCDLKNVCDISQLFLSLHGPLQTPRPQQPASAGRLV